MKKSIGLLAITVLSNYSFCQETLQSVTMNGNTTNRALIVNKTDGEYGLNASNGIDDDVLIGTTIPFSSLKYGWIQSSFNGRNLILNPNNGGNIGIATTSPIAKFHVYTNTDAYATVLGNELFNLRMAGTAGGSSGYSLLQIQLMD